MKRSAIYILLVFYIAVQLRPLTTVLHDALSHTFNRVEHLATVHYENGKYHVHKTLQAINDETSDKASQKAPSSQKTDEFAGNQIGHALHFNFETNGQSIPNMRIHALNLSNGFLSILIPPQKLFKLTDFLFN